MITLSSQQEEAIDKILKWYKTDEQCFTLAGYAGSGKTTIANAIRSMIPNCHFAAYTGKAAHVLREKGIQNASTIHGLLYQYEGTDEENNLVFSLKDRNKNGLVVIDEYSMLNQNVIDDLKSKCPKILFIGDPAQLPPIREKSSSLKPDFFLTEIHRQSMENPIIKWAHEIRNGNTPTKEFVDGSFSVMSHKDADEVILDRYEQVICAKNKTRHDINKAMRKYYGFSRSPIPVCGDKLICTKNNHEQGLYNGLVFTAKRDAYSWDKGNNNYKIEINDIERNVWDGDVLQDNSSKYHYWSKQERVEYAYAITCHKSQGSEFNSVIIYNEAWDDISRWLYTAVTRARDECTILI